MGITRRGEWKTNVDSNTQAIDPKDLTRKGAKVVGGNTSTTPVLGVSGKGMGLNGLSDFRKEAMFNPRAEEQEEVSPVLVHGATYKTNQNRSVDLVKTAEGVGSVFNRGVGGHTVRQGPEIYSPLFQMANLQLPRDRITMNAWNRNFYDTHPLVHNCINLHATYPISKISIKCKNSKIEQFFNEMAQNIDLIGTLQSIAQEFWMLGEKIDGASMITMADGTLKPISEIQIGDMVLTHLGNKKRVIERFIKPTSTVIEEHLKIHKLTIGGLADSLIISGKHPVLSMDGSKLKCPKSSCQNKNLRVFPDKDHCGNCYSPNITSRMMPDFKAAGDLKPQDIVYAPFNKEVVNNAAFTEDLCYIMGYWIAEGCYCKAPRKNYTKYNGIKFCSFDNDFLEDQFIPLFERFAGFSGHKYTSKSTHLSIGKNKYDYWFESECRNGPALAKFFLEHCGEFSKTKHLSETVMSLPPQMQRSLLAGFIDGDGCIDKDNNHALLYTSSRVLANQLMLILRRLGAHPTCSKHRPVLNGKLGEFSYKIRVIADEAYKLFSGLLRSKKAKLLKTRKWSSCRTGLQNNWQLLSIREIEDITEQYNDRFMYDIEVEDDHSYIANGIAIHNCFPYAELDESRGVWRHITVQNPDFIHVKKSPFGEFSVSLRPDPALLRLVQSSSPDDLRLISKMDKELVYHVRKGNSIPLDNFHVSHLRNLRAPYDIHGTSIIVSVYKDLMLYDKIRESKFAQADNMINPITLIKVGGTAEGEFHPTSQDLENYRQIFECHDEETEVLTSQGFKRFNDVIDYTVNDDGSYSAYTKEHTQIACFNSITECIEYHEPIAAHIYDYVGKMISFSGKKVDLCVTPNHRMWTDEKISIGGTKRWKDEWQFKTAQELFEAPRKYRLTSSADWSGNDLLSVDVIGFVVDMDVYLKYIGYVLSEGNIDLKTGRISVYQRTTSKCIDDIKVAVENFAQAIGKKCHHGVRNIGGKEVWTGRIYGKELTRFIANQIGNRFDNKHIPRWVLDLPGKRLAILISALVNGDGTTEILKTTTRFKYYTSSQQLSDDIYEAVYKLGFVPYIYNHTRFHYKTEYIVDWSTSKFGRNPELQRAESISKTDYNGKVWCFTVPTGLFITRRHGKITIQGNSAQYDLDFKVITHAGVSVERVGASGQIIDIAADLEFIMNNIFYGLM